LMRCAASTMAGKRSAQSWPLRVKQRTQAVAVMFDLMNPERAGRCRATFDGRHGSMKPEGKTMAGG
jgi:hypothetical protein